LSAIKIFKFSSDLRVYTLQRSVEAHLEDLLSVSCGQIPLREIDERFKSSARNFLGSGWSFYELRDGRAFWIHKSGKVVPSSRNTAKRP
jgi:hypothetical protein